jgi:4-amino-4-deoxy-L-arabinose transferase-like glycosyltransferase
MSDQNGGMERSDGLFAATVKALLLLALILAAYPLVRSFYTFEIDYNEGWNAFFQSRAMAGQPLYSGYSPLMFNNYPPLSFHIVGALGQLIGDPVLAGRLLSMAALAVIALSCGAVVRRTGGSAPDAGLAVATCLLLFACFATEYLGMNDPNMLALALITTALALHLGGGGSPGRAALTALLLTVGLLAKHNLFLIPLLIALDMLLRGTPRARMAFFGTGLALAAVSLPLMWLASEAFFGQLLAPRTWSVERAFLFTSEILGRFQAPLIVVGIGLAAARKRHPAGIVLAWLVLAMALDSFMAGGAGTDINVYFDIIVALAIGAGLVSRELRERGGSVRMQAALALAINAGALFYAPLGLGRFAVDALGDMAQRERLFRADAAWLRSVPGPAICESQLLCLAAGKVPFYDSFNANQAMLTGRLPADTLTGMLRRHQVAIVQVSSARQHAPGDPAGAQAMPARFVNFEDDVFSALDRDYLLVRTSLSGRFYRPR